jgi:hypothetical protein
MESANSRDERGEAMEKATGIECTTGSAIGHKPHGLQLERVATHAPVASREYPLSRRTPAGRWTTAASRSPGLWLKSSHHLPGAPICSATSGFSTLGEPLTVAGAARVSHPSSL